MSYILDALKKSEAERSNRDHADFAHRVPFESGPGKQREIWPYLLALALVANALVIGYVLWPGSEESVPVNTVAQAPVPEEVRGVGSSRVPEQPRASEASPKPDVSSPSSAGASSSERSGEAPKRESAKSPVQEQKSASPDRPEDTAKEVPDISDMPRSVQRRVPGMTFNAHLHSSNPSSRSVMINNRMLREGDRVGKLVIREITPAGVVFRLDGYVFQIDVVRDWQGAL